MLELVLAVHSYRVIAYHGKGKLHPWSFSSWNFLWTKELKRSRDLGLKTDLNCLLRAFPSGLNLVLSSEYIFLVFTLGEGGGGGAIFLLFSGGIYS